MKKINISSHGLTILFFGFALLVNTAVHYSHPAYSYYENEFQKVRDDIDKKMKVLDYQYSNFVATVESDFVPTISKLTEKIVSSSSQENVKNQMPEISDSEKLKKSIEEDYFDIRANFVMVDAKVSDFSERGAYINGWFYREGDFYLGRMIVSIHPECIFLDRGIIRPQSKMLPSSSQPNTSISSL